METIYDEYVSVQKEIDVLEERKKGIRERIQAELPAEGFKSEVVTAVWKTSKKWQYSPQVEAKEAEIKAKEAEIEPIAKELKDLKTVEELQGVATLIEEKKTLAITVK